MSDQNVDKLIVATGDPGKFQVMIYMLIGINFMIMLSNHLTMIFYAAKTEHHCTVGNGQNISDVIPILLRNNKRQWDGCKLFKNGSAKQTIPCNNGWTYYMDDGERTIISEVCVIHF